ncbi:hypothetical protein [Denitrobaculum tricleocarpae]|uniref:Uncharacterized protein n=1 Tax=Denitrobaculum tricleocarpae TaxID=2591009 RepID=A0A545TP97_9PROT|nr:hypothetical protein [Denitrobaculum tricleocarpae]TQV78991.1 hypothetical protein FKG95_15005 [Denitrobaculum tricleocarpae]
MERSDLARGRRAVSGLVALLCFATLQTQADASQEDILTAESFTSGWQGEILWTGETAPKRTSLSRPKDGRTGAGGQVNPLRVSVDLGRAGCSGPAQESARIPGGRVVQLKLSGNTDCKASIVSIQLVAVAPREIGILVLGAAELLAQGTLQPLDSAQQLVIAPASQPEFSPAALKGPESVVGYFYVAPAGSVYELLPAEKGFNLKIVATSQFESDAGLRTGEIVGRGRYNAAGLAFSRSEKIRLSEDSKAAYRHCPPIYAPAQIYDLIDITDRNAVSVPEDVIALTPRNKQFCARVRTSRESCRVVSCSEYQPHSEKQTFLVKDGDLARRMGDAARAAHTPSETYAQALGRLKQAQAADNRARNSESKGYFDPGGACGAISCEQEDTLQFIMDQYWK